MLLEYKKVLCQDDRKKIEGSRRCKKYSLAQAKNTDINAKLCSKKHLEFLDA